MGEMFVPNATHPSTLEGNIFFKQERVLQIFLPPPLRLFYDPFRILPCYVNFLPFPT